MRSLFRDVAGVRSLFGYVGMSDSEALLQAVRFLGYGNAITFGNVRIRSLLGMWGAIAVLRDTITFDSEYLLT